MWILISIALAGPETTCDGVDDDFDGEIDEETVCSTAQAICAQNGIDGHSFLGCEASAPLTQLDAAIECEMIGYFLAAPTNAAENDLATSLLAPTEHYWLGVNDFAVEGQWMNTTGQQIFFDAWFPGEPNGSTLENCVVLEPGTPPNLWADNDCDDASSVFGFVCEARCNELTYYFDDDGDGYGAGDPQIACDAIPSDAVTQNGDCADTDPHRNPGIATDICNGLDDDCDGPVDEDDPPQTWYQDLDGDGYGDADTPTSSCTQPLGYVSNSTDCNDEDEHTNPGVLQDLCDGVDNDCDGPLDEDEPPVIYYQDADHDGFGASGTDFPACAQPSGYVTDDTDCDDSDGTAYPGAPEVCDGDLETCGGTIDAGVQSTFYFDHDDDGFGDPNTTIQACTALGGYRTNHDDCDDDDPTIFPGATEVCDGEDNNCDAQTDEGVLNTYWTDSDADGYGDSALPTAACSEPAGTADNPDDCDDHRSEAYPEAPELCNGLDDDCDNVVDNGTNDVQWYVDGDDDGFGDAIGAFQCEQPSGQVSTSGDCDDADPHINPAATEECDSVDRDCDGEDWNGLTLYEFWPDIDQDGFGAGSSVVTCESTQAGYVENHDDCDDGDDHVNPSVEEICDGIDNDCDSLTDDADTVPNPNTWYPDADGDDFGDGDHPIEACAQPAHTTDRPGDCDDSEPNVFEGAPEACADGLDNDCDSLVDADDPDFVNGGVAYAQDADDDNFGDPFNTLLACSGEQPLGWVPLSLGEDCDDGNSARNPGLDEVCDGIDNDCVGGPDDGLFFLDYFVDSDGDGFGDPGPATINACQPVAGRSGNGLDCDDNDPHVNPNAIEVCNNADDDCDGTDDDGLDNEDYYPDADDDGFGDASATAETSCEVVEGKVTDNSDCDDTDGHVYPNAPEDPEDGIDSDCDGTFEEPPPEELPDTDGDGVPDSIDLVEPSDDPAPTPTKQDYGCGCTQSSTAWSWSMWWRRR